MFPPGPAGEGKAGGSGLNFRPPPGADTSPPRPWEQLGKFSRNREASEEARKCDAPTPTPGLGLSNPRQWKRYVSTLTSRSQVESQAPLPRPARPARRARTPAPAASQKAAGCPRPPLPIPGSRTPSSVPSPHFSLGRPRPTRMRHPLPRPRPGKEDGGEGRGFSSGSRGAGPRFGAPGRECAKVG